MTDTKPLPPPDDYMSWLDYAVDAMETRSLFLDHCGGFMKSWADYDDVRRSAMREAAAEELKQLRSKAGQ